MLFGISAGGGDTLSTMKYTSPRMQAEHKAVKSSPAEDSDGSLRKDRRQIEQTDRHQQISETILAILLIAD